LRIYAGIRLEDLRKTAKTSAVRQLVSGPRFHIGHANYVPTMLTLHFQLSSAYVNQTEVLAASESYRAVITTNIRVHKMADDWRRM
jgi:hypothetical protein